MNPQAQERPKLPRRPLHGVLLLDKPVGLSSNDALQRVKRLLRAQKAGHTGTLDPMASGLLPICLGAATKFSQVSLDADKAYEAVVQLGVVTSTGDAEGQVLERRAVQVTPEALQDALRALTGPIDQVPPMHSALKKDGRPLYEYARQGIEIEREARRVVIHELRAQPTDDPTVLKLLVRCSKGTYIRTLAEDLGRLLGCGASLLALRRTASGALTVDRCVTLDALEAADETQRLDCLHPVDSLLAHWPAVRLDEGDAARFLTGLRRRLTSPASDWPNGVAVRVYGPEQPAALLLGSAHVAAGELIPDRLLSPLELESLLKSSSGAAAPTN